VSSPPAEQRRHRQREEARRSILDATESLLVEEGYEKFSMRRLADRCGYTAPTIYHYFGDKPGLIDTLLDERFGRLLVRLRRVPRAPDAADNLLELARAFIRFGLRHPTHYRLLTTPRGNGATPPPSAERSREILEGPLRELHQQGRLVCADLEAVIQSLWALTHGLISLRIHRPDYPWAKDLADVGLNTFVRGLLQPECAPEQIGEKRP
jgi:AcrR family transcriptional regulator